LRLSMLRVCWNGESMFGAGLYIYRFPPPGIVKLLVAAQLSTTERVPFRAIPGGPCPSRSLPYKKTPPDPQQSSRNPAASFKTSSLLGCYHCPPPPTASNPLLLNPPLHLNRTTKHRSPHTQMLISRLLGNRVPKQVKDILVPNRPRLSSHGTRGERTRAVRDEFLRLGPDVPSKGGNGRLPQNGLEQLAVCEGGGGVGGFAGEG